MANGIIIIDKPDGWTSQDVAAKLRGVFRERRVATAEHWIPWPLVCCRFLSVGRPGLWNFLNLQTKSMWPV